MTSAFRKIVAVLVKSVNPLALPDKLMIRVWCCISEKKIRLPEDYTVLSLEHNCRIIMRSVLSSPLEISVLRSGALSSLNGDDCPWIWKWIFPFIPLTNPNKLLDGPGA